MKIFSKELMDVIKMRSNFIQNYEKELVESAVEAAMESVVEAANKDVTEQIAERMRKEKYPPSEILKITGVNILRK